MDRTEQRERLKDILDATNEVVTSLNAKKDVLEDAIKQIEQLDEKLQTIGDVDGWDVDDLKRNVANCFFTAELESVHELATDFQSDLEAYCDEISESRSERLQDKYADLDSIIKLLDASEQEYEDIESTVDHLQDAIHMIKQLRN